MTNKAENNIDASIGVRESTLAEYHEELRALFSRDQQVAPSCPSKSLTQTEENILRTINTCFKNWHKPWQDTYLADDREFKTAYQLMEGLLHYEYQITNEELSSDRIIAIAQAVARLIDYGNAILGIDIVIRSNDDAFSETDPLRMTTIELFQAHVKANNLREKLLYDYFKKDKPDSSSVTSSPDQEQANALQSPNCLQIPRGSTHSLHPQVEARSPKSPRGSFTSINLLVDSGRRTPLQGLTSPRELDHVDLSQSVELTHLMATIRSRAFSASPSTTTRLTLLPGILSKIESLLTSPSNNVKIRQCFDLLDLLLDSIERLPEESRDKEVSMISTTLLRHLVRKVYVNDRDDLIHFQQAHWATCLISLIRLMGPHFNGHLRQFSNLADLGAFLNDYLFVIKRLLSSSGNRLNASSMGNFDLKDDIHQAPTYPDCWIEMTLLACSTFLSSLTSLFQILCQVFTSNLSIWLSFIDCLLHFPSHESLRQGRLMMKERQRLLADDIRRTSAEYVWISWESLSLPHRQQLLEDLMGPLLRASIALHSKHRSVLLPIFYDMMRCDYTVQYITPRNLSSGTSLVMGQTGDGISNNNLNQYHRNQRSAYQSHEPPTLIDPSLPYLSPPQDTSSEDGTVLTRFTHLIVGKLNYLMLDLKLGDEFFIEELCAAISGNLNPKYYNKDSSTGAYGDTSQFKSMAKQTSDLISEFLHICMDYRHANRLAYNHLLLLCLFKLILFFRDKVDRGELYLTYLYNLTKLHHVGQRYVEAGYTLLEHAKSLTWSDSPLENYYRVITKFYKVSPQQLTDNSTLKIYLYNTIIEYFDQGQNWEDALPLCRELINYYEFKVYEYGKLAQLLDKMSSFYKNISDSKSRSNPEYFRVTFYGRGFPTCLKDMTVIYRGRPYEKLSDFQSTIISKYPDARPLSTLAKPNRSILDDPEARYLQINACSPIVDLQSKFPAADIKKIREPLLDYFRHNRCDKFQFSRRVNRPAIDDNKQVVSDDNFANMWRERTTLTTNTFPGMLPFFPVFLIEKRIISPIESAIEDLERTNDRLATMVNRFKADEQQTEDVRLLSQLLLGVIDAAVNGGISKYEEAFFENASEKEEQSLTSPAIEPSPPSTTISSSASKLMTSSCSETADTPAIPLVAIKVDQSKPFSASSCNVGDEGSRLVVALDTAQVDKLKSLIAKQIPLLDEAIQLHCDRVADVMRPQHEHLEASYKKLKHHITTKYYRYLPPEYNKTLSSGLSSSTLRSHRSLTRSPRSTLRASTELRLHLLDPQQNRAGTSRSPSSSMRASRLSSKRMSDVGSNGAYGRWTEPASSGEEEAAASALTTLTSSIPYRQLANERKSLPSLTCIEATPLSNSTRTPRNSSRNGHANGYHNYEYIADVADNQTEAHGSQHHGTYHELPKPRARSSIKIKLPFSVAANEEMEDELLQPVTPVNNDESPQYMHLINCDIISDSQTGGEEQKVKDEKDVESIQSQQAVRDEINLVTF